MHAQHIYSENAYVRIYWKCSTNRFYHKKYEFDGEHNEWLIIWEIACEHNNWSDYKQMEICELVSFCNSQFSLHT